MRQAPRKIFRSADRIPEVHFYTSNDSKFLQARNLFDRAGLQLRHFKASTEPYSEDYGSGKDALLRRAVREVAEKIGGEYLFFVEDTSMRLEALSTEGEDVPGLSVKEWFQQTDFASLDKTLRDLGNNRVATVKSDIALHLPGLSDPIIFRGETRGVVADSPAPRGEPTRYPWLASDTFNGWFVPDGAPSRLSELDLEQSLDFDFRAKAIAPMIDRLEEYAAILNIPTGGFRKRQTAAASKLDARQLVLDQVAATSVVVVPPILVIGATCAGKTTFAERADIVHNLRHVEASSIVRMQSGQRFDSAASALESAKEVLDKGGPDIIARQVLKQYAEELRTGLVLTGFRTIEELLVVCTEVPSTRVVFVDASDRTRFERNLKRGRYQDARTMDAFRKLDEGQSSLGLLGVARDLADITVANEDSLDEYFGRVDAIVTGDFAKGGRDVRSVPDAPSRRLKSQLYRCLRVLVSELSLSSREISDRTAQKGLRLIATRNVNETLKHYPELAARHIAKDEDIRYLITAAGKAYVRFVETRATASGEQTETP
jgi:inosine/xanthosine triphosphate pyrophosphatase family protein/adenylate kinase family enzyme